jgi:hypothetical protein
MKYIDSVFILLGYALKAFIVALFGLTISCLLMTVFDRAELAADIMAGAFPTFMKSALTLLASISISGLLKSLS